ncbi:hypothetical protein CHS0354_029278 [Potamilus streckersoni]|uniref:Protein kinase domain-containing protein n=1 Tax=Potamilus streckersoni TaxID=2493646 RepID=A0AAE0W5C8_9BIVA|nr:hypothetical protein CHS0354_029278 [Potamilus streckersoni]
MSTVFSSNEYLDTETLTNEKKRRRRKKGTPIEDIRKEKHWKKLLQAQEPHASVVKYRCFCGKKYCCFHNERTLQPLSGHSKLSSASDSFLSSIFRRFYKWVNPNQRHRFDSLTSSQTSDDSDAYCSDDFGCKGFYSDSGLDIKLRCIQYRHSQNSSGDGSMYSNVLGSEKTCSILSSDSEYSLTSLDTLEAPGVPLIVVTNCNDSNHDTFTHKRTIEERRSQSFSDAASLSSQTNRNMDIFENSEALDERSMDDDAVFKQDLDVDVLTCDFMIPYKEISLGECIRTGRTCALYSGQWHGEVIIHYFGTLDKEKNEHFMSDVRTMGRIRHENIALFVGACAEPCRLLIVTSVNHGKSLHDSIHVLSEHIDCNNRIITLRQIANAMGYLHAKDIVIKNLTSRNVLLCPSVKLSFLDCGMVEKRHDRTEFAVIPRGSLAYLAPELLRSCIVDPPYLVRVYSCDKATDIFSYGTISFEVLFGHFPCQYCCPESVIWQVCNGKRQSMASLKASRELKSLIRCCWNQIPESRPAFSDIGHFLNEKVQLRKSHTLSEPHDMNRLGLDERTS